MQRVAPRQLARFFLAFSPVAKLLFLPALLSLRLANDLWIPLIFCFALDGAVLLLSLALARRGATLTRVLSHAFGRWGYLPLALLYALFFLAKAFLLFGEEGRFVTAELYETTPLFVFLIPLFLVGAFFATKKLQAVGRLADIFFFFSLVALGALILFALPVAKWQDLMPVAFRSGRRVIGAIPYCLLYFGEPLYLFLMLGNFTVPRGDARKIVGGFALSAGVVILFFAVFYAVFTTLSGYETAAYYNVAKYGAFSTAAGRVDLIFTYLLRTVSAVGLSLPGYFAVRALLLLTKGKMRTALSLLFFLAAGVPLAFAFPYLGRLLEGLRLYGGLAAILMQYLIPLYAGGVFLLFPPKEGAPTPVGLRAKFPKGKRVLGAAYPLKRRGGEPQ